MSKQVINASTIVSLSLSASKADATLTMNTAAWINAVLDALRASGVAADKSGGAAARLKVRTGLVEACMASATYWDESAGAARPMTAKGRKALVDLDPRINPMGVIESVLGPARANTWRSYLSGVSRAYQEGVAWSPRSHIKSYWISANGGGATASPDDATGKGSLGEAAVRVTADRKARTVTFTAGVKAAVNADDVQKIIAAITADPGRMALALAYIKAQGWIAG